MAQAMIALGIKPDHLENLTFRFSNIGGSIEIPFISCLTF